MIPKNGLSNCIKTFIPCFSHLTSNEIIFGISCTGDAQSSLFVIGGPINCFSRLPSSWIDEDGGGGGGPWYPSGGGTNGCPNPIGCPKSRESIWEKKNLNYIIGGMRSQEKKTNFYQVLVDVVVVKNVMKMNHLDLPILMQPDLGRLHLVLFHQVRWL